MTALPAEARKMIGEVEQWIETERIAPQVAAGVLAGLLALVLEIIRETEGDAVAQECAGAACEQLAESAGLATIEVDADNVQGGELC